MEHIIIHAYSFSIGREYSRHIGSRFRCKHCLLSNISLIPKVVQGLKVMALEYRMGLSIILEGVGEMK